MRKYRSTRGERSHGRDRCTLHKKHLAEFKAWIAAEHKFHIENLTKHPYEVLHLVVVDRSGDGPHVFVYRNDHNDHLTVQAELVPFMRRWLKERKDKKNL